MYFSKCGKRAAFSKKFIVTETIKLHMHLQVLYFIFLNIVYNLIALLCVLFDFERNENCPALDSSFHPFTVALLDHLVPRMLLFS